MGEAFQSVFGMSPWGPLALAFLFGVAFGWVLWGARRDGIEDFNEPDAVVTKDGEEPREIIVIKAELQAARSLLEEREEQDGAVTEQLSAMDEAIKRANGRLKTILAAIRRAAAGKPG